MNLFSFATPTSLPDWMLLFAFFASLGLTILVLIEAVSRSLRKSTLEVVLTREVFYRLLDSGESLYANAVLVAYDAGALVQDIKATLTKHNGATKTFDLRIAQIGEKYRAPDGTYQFSFHSTSPLNFVPVNSPQRMVYICEQDSYAEATRSAFFDFNRRLSELRAQYSTLQAPDETTVARLRADVGTLLDTSCTRLMDQMQVEAGEYELTVTLNYRQEGKVIPFLRNKTSSSSVRFTVENNVREYFRYTLRQYLEARAANGLLNQTNPTPAPSYNPHNVIEVT